MRRILTVAEAAVVLGCKEPNVYRSLKIGTLERGQLRARTQVGVVAEGEVWRAACKRRGVEEPDPYEGEDGGEE